MRAPSLQVSHKLGLAAAAFVLPLAFIVWSLVAEQNIAIRFAAQEVVGARYLAALAPVQQQAATMALTGAPPGAGQRLAEAVAALDAASGGVLDSSAAASAASAALRDPATLDAGRAKLRDLIGRIGDRSNLILDNVLDTYYLTDVVLNRLPDAVDRLADLTLGEHTPAGDAEARAQFLVSLGTLVGDLDGMDASLTSAEQADGGAAIQSSLDGEYHTLKAALADSVTGFKDGKVDPATAAAITARTASFSQHATEQLTDLLAGRVHDLRHAQARALGITAVLFALAVAAMVAAVRRGVTRPLARLNTAMLRLADGDLDTPLPVIASRDELGAMGRALVMFQRQGLEKRRLEAAAATTLELRERQQVALEKHTQDFGASVIGVLGSLGTSAKSMRQAADGMAHAVEQTRTGSASTAAGAEESTRNLAAVAAATEQLTASVDEIARQAGEATAAARDAVARAEATGTTVGSLNIAAAQVGSVVSLIADIAGKTNLLALNATIEAARVGEAGKGFAVVASEVKQLAAQTSRATEEIRAQIAGMQARTDEAVGAVRTVADAIARMDGVAAAIAASVQEQGAATREIASSVQAVAAQNQGATSAMREVSSVAEDASHASQAVLTAAGEVARVSDTMMEEVSQFLKAVTAANVNERRRWERVPAHQAPVALRWTGGGQAKGALIDLSRGGASVALGATLAPGTELEIDLPGADGPVAARVVRCRDGAIGLSFRQDQAMLARADAALATLGAASGVALPAAA